jgi:hypothetical protein
VIIPTQPVATNQIDHMVFLIDASASMHSLRARTVEVVDAEIAHLKTRSQELDREIRLTVYLLSDRYRDGVTCLFYDMDVLRVPGIFALYHPGGNTPLIDATIKSQEDLRQTAQLYGDHAFLTYVFTDGEENASRRHAHDLRAFFATVRDNETLAILVPDQRAAYEAKRYGFPAGNVAIWNPTSGEGIREGFASTVRLATDNYIAMRATGTRSTNSLFTVGGADKVNSSNIHKAGMRPLPPGQYSRYKVGAMGAVIKPFVESKGHTYRLGMAFYELVKREKVQANKDVLIEDKTTGEVFHGAHAREVLGLPDYEVPVLPDRNPQYRIFIKSTSVNRKLPPGTDLIVVS